MFCFQASNKMLNEHSNIKSDAQTSAPPSSKATGKVSSHKHLWGSRLFCLQHPDRAASLPRRLLRICQVMSQSSSAFIPGRKTWGQARISSQTVAISTQFLHLAALRKRPISKGCGGYYTIHCEPERAVLGSTGFRPTVSTFMKGH